jgi:hypothetical protein
MMLHSILGDALTLGQHAAVAFKPLAQTTTSTIASGVATATSAVSNSIATSVPLTAVVPAATPIAAASTSTGGSFGLHNPFDYGWLTTAPNPAMGPFAWLFFLICLVVFLGSLYFLIIARSQYRDTNSLNYRVVNKYAPWFLGVAVIGLFFVLLRLPIWPGGKDANGNVIVSSFEFGGQRVWFYLVFLTLIGFAVWFFRYYPAKYRADLADWQKRAVKRQYDPTAVRRAGMTTTPGGSPTGVKRRPRR